MSQKFYFLKLHGYQRKQTTRVIKRETLDTMFTNHDFWNAPLSFYTKIKQRKQAGETSNIFIIKGSYDISKVVIICVVGSDCVLSIGNFCCSTFIYRSGKYRI